MSLFFVIIPKYLHRDNAVWPSPIDKVPVLLFPTMCRCPYGALYWPTNNRPRFLIIKDRPSHLRQWIEVCSTWDEVNNDTNSIFFLKDKLPKKKRKKQPSMLSFPVKQIEVDQESIYFRLDFLLEGLQCSLRSQGQPRSSTLMTSFGNSRSNYVTRITQLLF